MAVMMAVMMFVLVPRAAVSAERVQEVLRTDSSVILPPNPIREIPRPGRTEMRNVEFHYPGAEEPVLYDISCSAQQGKTTAIIGSTGSGKSTLIKLIPRLFDATAGTVTVGGVSVRDLAPDVLSKTIGYVPQRPYLFTGTVASNLRYGDPEASDEELWRALEIA